MTDPRLGRISPDGEQVDYPAVNMSGVPYNRPPLNTRGLGNGWFVVLDDFDLNADVSEVAALIPAEVSSESKKSRPTL